MNHSLFHHSLNPKRVNDLEKPKRATEISQSSGPIPLVADETVIKEWEDRMERAATTASSLEAEQDSGNINRTQSMATRNEPLPQHNSAFWNEIEVNTGDSRLMLSVLVNAARHTLTIFWAIAKAKTVNGELHIQALVDKKKVIVTETSSRRKQRKDTKVSQPNGPTEPVADETKNVKSVPTHSNDPLLSGEDRLKLTELMELCISLQSRVLALETTKTNQALEIGSLKKRVKKLEKKASKRTHNLKRMYKVGLSAKVISSENEDLDDQEDASKQGRIINNIDANEGVTLVDETQGRYDADEDINQVNVPRDEDMFCVHDLGGEEVVVKHVDVSGDEKVEQSEQVAEKEISTANPVTIACEVVTTTSVGVTTASATTRTVDELTLSQTLIEIKAAKHKAVTTAATTVTPVSTRPKAKGIVETDYELAQRLQAEEQQDLTIKEKSKLFQELLEKRRKFFAAKRAEEKRNKPPTKAQQRSYMSTYLKNMAGWRPKDLKNKSFAEVQKLFDKEMKRVNTFVDFRTELMEEKLEQERIKKQKIDDDQEEAEMKQHMEIVVDEEEIAVDVIPLATKPPIINIDREDLETLWKLVKAIHENTRPEEEYERGL
ncbi:hypothetical protein Tco_0668200 [Tanacetum coccineum]